jgi:hypothetical protein
VVNEQGKLLELDEVEEDNGRFVTLPPSVSMLSTMKNLK